MLLVGPIALKFTVPTLVSVLIILVGSDPTEIDSASSPLATMGPSTLVGKAVVLSVKGSSKSSNLVGSYLIWKRTKVTELLPGLIIISRAIISPICFWSGVGAVAGVK